MKRALLLAAALIAAVHAPIAAAQVYKYKDSSGRMVISDTPPPTNARDSRSYDSAPGGTGTSASYADKDLEFKKRRQEAAKASEKEAKEQANAVQKRENCERARRHLATLESGERLAVANESGGKRIMEDGERRQEIERARNSAGEWCN